VWTERCRRLHSGCVVVVLLKNFLFILWQYVVPVAEDQEIAHVVVYRYVVQCRPADDCQYFETRYEGCPESIQPFWISREPFAWPWCNLAASQRRPYCASVNSHSPVGLVSRQWDAVDWTCVLCDCRIHNDRASRSATSRQCACPFYSSRVGFFGKASHHPGLSGLIQPRFGSLRLLAFPRSKIAVEKDEICTWDSHTVHKLSQRRLTADCLAPRESDCSRMYSKVSSDWLPCYIKTTRRVPKIFKMAGYFPDSPRTAFITKQRQYISPKRR